MTLIANCFEGTEEAAEYAMAQLSAESRKVNEKELMIEVPYLGTGGIRSSALVSTSRYHS